MTEVAGRRGSLWSAINWMGGLSLLLFWLPVIGPFIAGLVGGRKAGGFGRAIAAVFLPGILMGGLVYGAVMYLTRDPFWSFLAGIGGLWISFLQVGPMLVGALVGALVGGLEQEDA